MRSRKTAKILLNSVLESLEPRWLFSSPPINGTSGTDHILIQMNGATLSWKFDSDTSWTSLGTGIDSLTVSAGDGNDTINIDDVVANVLTVNCGNGNDVVTIQQVDVQGYVSIAGGAGNDAVTVTDVTDSLVVVSGDANNDTITVDGFSDAYLSILCGSGDDVVHLDDVIGADGVHVYGFDDQRPGSGEWSGDGSESDTLYVGKNDTVGGDVSDFPTIYWDDGDPQHEDEDVIFDDGGQDAVIVNDRQDDADHTWYIPPLNTSSPSDPVLFYNELGTLVSSITGYDYNSAINPGFVLKCGSGDDTLNLVGANVGYKIEAGDGADTFNLNSGGLDGNGGIKTEQNTLSGGAGNDVFNFGTSVGVMSSSPATGTLYGIGNNQINGDSGSDSLVIDDSNYDSTSSYSSQSTDSGAVYRILNSTFSIYNGSNTLQWTMSMDVESFELYMQSKNGRGGGNHVHPSIEITNDNTSFHGPIILHPGSVLTGGSYDYNTIYVKQATANPVYITPSAGSDHVTIGDSGGNLAETIFKGAPPMKLRDALSGYGDIFYPLSPDWVLDSNSTDVDLPVDTSMLLGGPSSEVIFQAEGRSAAGNTVTNPSALSNGVPARVVLTATSTSLSLGATNLTFSDELGKTHVIYLPAVSLTSGHSAYFWVGTDGTTYVGSSGQTSPDFTTIARAAPHPVTDAAIGSFTINSNGLAKIDVGEGNDFTWDTLSVPASGGGVRGTIDVISGVATFHETGQVIGALKIEADGKAVIDAGQGNALKMSSLTIASGGMLDLTDSAAIIAGGGSTVRDDVADWIASGRNADPETALGQWDGTGIVSSTALANEIPENGLDIYNVGSLLNDDLDTFMGTGNSYITFGGQSVSSTDVLMRYTYMGDCNLDGLVDVYNDAPLFVDGYNGAGASWILGDFNYDGVVDLDNDYFLFLDGYNNQGSPL